MIRKIVYATLASAALMATAARAEETIVWWDFLSGGDGVRMKSMIDEFNKEHAGKVKIDATTLEWGVPFYSKVQTSAAVGQGPDVMTYHELRMPLGVSTGTLSPLAPEELAASGIKASDFGPANWKAAQGPDGKQYAVPLDIHSIILYYNKDLLKKAGLLGDDGKPKGLDGQANWDAALAKLTTKDVTALAVPNDGGSGWRIFYTLLNQQGGEFLKDGKFLDGDNLAKATDGARRDAEVDEERMGADQYRISRLDRALHLGQGGDAYQRRLGDPDDGRPRQEGPALRLGRGPDPGDLLAAGDVGGFAFLRDPGPQGQSGQPREAQDGSGHDPLVQLRTRSSGRAAAMSRPICRSRKARNSRR